MLACTASRNLSTLLRLCSISAPILFQGFFPRGQADQLLLPGDLDGEVFGGELIDRGQEGGDLIFIATLILHTVQYEYPPR